MELYENQYMFLMETLKAIYLNEARIGKKHYTFTITKLELQDIMNQINIKIKLKTEMV